MGEPLPRGDADAVVERAVPTAGLQAIRAGTGLGDRPRRQRGCAVDLVVDDRSVADRWAHDRPAIGTKRDEQAVELRPRQEDGVGHEGLPAP
jgi:hypothetical protein